MNEEILKLQNGSDIRGVALEGVPGEEVNLTEASIARSQKPYTHLRRPSLYE